MIEGKDDEMSKFKKEVSEKFSMTPAAKSIKEKEVDFEIYFDNTMY